MKTRILLSLTLLAAGLDLLALMGREIEIATVLSGVTLLLCLVSWIGLLVITRGKSAETKAAAQASSEQKAALEAKLHESTQQNAAATEELARLQARLRTELEEKSAVLAKRDAEIQALRAQKSSGDTLPLREASDTAVLQFLRSLQERGRFLDFAMAEINRLPDAQVGAAARVVHQGVKVVLDDYFDIQAISSASEGSLVPIPGDDTAEHLKFRILSRDAADASVSQGRLLHRGWEALAIRLPQSMPRASGAARIIAPAEIDVQRP